MNEKFRVVADRRNELMGEVGEDGGCCIWSFFFFFSTGFWR